MDPKRMILKQSEIGPMMNFVYLVGCPETREAAVVDPAWDATQIAELAQDSDLKIRYILLTHGHPDHMNAVEALMNETGAEIYVNSHEVDYMMQVARSFGMSTDFLMKNPEKLHRVSDEDTIKVGNIPVRFLHTPGHTPGSQCILVEGCLLSGDTLFVDACGRVDMPGGDPEKMWWSLNQRLRSLDDGIVLYPGHDYGGRPVSTIGEQKQTNPYMQYDSVQQFMRDMG